MSRRIATSCLLGYLVVVFSCASVAVAQEKSPAATTTSEDAGPLYLQDPHDLIVIKGQGSEAHKVLPITLPNRKIPASPRPNDRLVVRFLDRPGEEFSVEWRHVASLELYEQRVLGEARRLVTAGRFDDAFPQLQFLRLSYPQLAELPAVVEDFLHGSARQELAASHPRTALSLLDDLHTMNPARAGLADDLATAVGTIVDGNLQRNEVTPARTMLARFIAKYPAHPQVKKWREQFYSEAEAKLQQAQAAVAKQSWSEARDAAQAALARRPDLVAARELATTLAQREAVVRVAVRSPTRTVPARSALERLLDFAVRRDERLIDPAWIDLTEIGPSGGVYRPVVGELARDAEGNVLWRLPLDGPLTGYDLSQQLWQRSQLRRGELTPAWDALVRSVSVHDIYQATFNLSRPHLLPEGLLVDALRGSARGQEQAPQSPLRNYTLAPLSTTENRITRAENVTLPGPAVVLERYCATEREVLQRTAAGEVDIVDRLELAELADWRERREYAIEAYRVPSVHLLALRRTSPRLQQRTFRRGLIYALDRAKMLDELVLRGQKIAGCELSTGPFSRGLGTDDPLGYAINPLVKSRPYDIDLAATLVALAQTERKSPAKEQPAEKAVPEPVAPAEVNTPLRLAHPPTPIIRAVVKAMTRQWEQIGVSVVLVELPPGDSGWSTPCDLLYAEVSSAEPLVDARALLGEQGLGGPNPYLALALDELDRARDWSEARHILQQIHQLVHDDAALIPLWQLTEHFARRKSLAGVGAQPLSLFHRLDDWRVSVNLPPAEDTLWPGSGAKP